jgi:hypothetical protein
MTRKAAFRSNQPQRDHVRPRGTFMPTTEAIEARIESLISPAALALAPRFAELGLRNRILPFPVMVAVLLAIVWRRVEGLTQLVALLEQRGLFWVAPTQVSAPGVTQRLESLPASLFAELFDLLVPTFQARARERVRPLPAVVERVRAHYPTILAADGSTLEALFHKLGELRGVPGTLLAGRMLALLDVVSKQAVAVLRDPSPTGNDHQFQVRLLRLIEPGALVLLDAGFYDFRFFAQVTGDDIAFITRGRAKLAGTVVAVLQDSPTMSDRLVRIGEQSRPTAVQTIRVVDVRIGGKWRRYLTNVLEPAALSVVDIIELYALRWRVEEAFLQVKRLLGLRYLNTGSENGIQLQIWTTWLVYGVLVDLCDAIAEELDLPLERISIEMVYRGLPFYCDAYQHGEATDPVAYFAAKHRMLGIVKAIRKHRLRPPLINQLQTLNL